jgi:hypothetical protein
VQLRGTKTVQVHCFQKSERVDEAPLDVCEREFGEAPCGDGVLVGNDETRRSD